MESAMSVRSGILAVLSLGAAYGSQLHSEVEARTHRTGTINVGQIYSTLDRLQTQGMVRAKGLTDDGLPLYSLTESGRAEVGSWMIEADPRAGWADFVGHVLMVASLPGSPISILIENYRLAFRVNAQGDVDATDAPDALVMLGDTAAEILSDSALRWLDEVERTVLASQALARPLGRLRPRRGRRPRQQTA
jgi:DNA-binding PadR family transcriptional regulator